MTPTPIPRTIATLWKWTRRALPVIISFACLIWVLRQFSHVGFDALQAAFAQISTLQWGGAALATAISFWALGAYDATWHKALGTGVSARDARRSGMIAVAVSQTLGFGAVTATLVRWIAIPKLSTVDAAKLSLCVTLSFMAVWAALAGLSYAALGLPIHQGWLALALLIACGAAYRQRARLAQIWAMGCRAGLPRLAVFVVIDLTAAAAALYILFPQGFAAAFPIVAAAYVLALGAGLLSNAPAGLGAFEATFCALLAVTPDAALLAAILAFRLIYYALPATIAAVALSLSRLRATGDITPPAQSDTPPHWDLLHQGGSVLPTREGIWLIRHLLGTTVALGGPIQNPGQSMPPAILRRRLRPRLCAIYKCDAPTALSARAAGWHVMRIASEAEVDPRHWTSAGSAQRQLRRKLTQATKAGVTITATIAATPLLTQMSAIAKDWAQSNGGEMGFSMGVWNPAYVAQQRVYHIWVGDQLAGFVTFQARADTWALDLIRFRTGTPAGAVHLAIAQAIQDAGAAGAASLTLGAVPAGDHAIARRMARDRAGLIQFKNCFGPRWTPLYHASPSRVEALLTGCLIFIAIQNPWPRLMMIMNKNIRPQRGTPPRAQLPA